MSTKARDTKKLPQWAQELIADLRNDLAKAKAISIEMEVPARDLPPPESIRGLSKGWDFNAHRLMSGYGSIVYKACSSSINHGEGWERTSTQRPRHLYSTATKAWQALRGEVVDLMKRKLAAIDAEIAKQEEPALTPTAEANTAAREGRENLKRSVAMNQD